MAGDIIVPAAIRALRAVVRKGITAVRDRLPQAGHDLASIEPALARNTQRIQQPAARIRQQQSASQAYQNQHFTRWFTTAAKESRKPTVRSAVSKIHKTAPFASALRPKLCGALPRSAGGYSIGGSARYFSHQTAPAQVIGQVSQAMRAFVLTGKDMGYYSQRRRHTQTYVKGQIQMHLAAASTDRLAPGAYIDFHIAPTLSCMSAADPVGYTTLDNSRGGFMDELDVDINSAIRDITIVYQDLKRLSKLGELPITLVSPTTLRVHFRGCDSELVTNLCDEVGVFSGVIHEDERFAFDKILPEANNPVNWQEMLSSEDEFTDWDVDLSQSSSEHVRQQLYELEKVSDEARRAHWDESADEFYDEIDPGGEEEFSGSDGFGNVVEGYLKESGGYTNPWVMPVPDRSGTF